MNDEQVAGPAERQSWERPHDPCWSCGGDAEARDDIHVRCIDTKGIDCEVMNHWYTRKTWNTRASLVTPNNQVACVNCKVPVVVTTANAIRCDGCASLATPADDYLLAKQDHSYAVGFLDGLRLATVTEQSRIHALSFNIDDYTDDYKQKLAAIERQRAESLKVMKQGSAGLATPTAPGVEMLARRAYPELKRSGLCSWHQGDGHYECQTCYSDPNALLAHHMEVSRALYDQILELAGLSDPPNGRIGTNAIVAELRRKLSLATSIVCMKCGRAPAHANEPAFLCREQIERAARRIYNTPFAASQRTTILVWADIITAELGADTSAEGETTGGQTRSCALLRKRDKHEQ